MDLEFGPSTDLENPQDCMTKYSLLINLTCYQNSSLRQSGFLMSETDASHCFTMLDNPIKHVLLSEKVCWGGTIYEWLVFHCHHELDTKGTWLQRPFNINRSLSLLMK